MVGFVIWRYVLVVAVVVFFCFVWPALRTYRRRRRARVLPRDIRSLRTEDIGSESQPETAYLGEVAAKPIGLEIELDDVEQCAVCLEDAKPGTLFTRLDCGHEFHTACARSWASRADTCPICRKPFYPDVEAEAPKLRGMEEP
ncbi:hypothetical protein NDN08_007772 [Rhodosorus marinus]|uniref:RING-type domain-containing protein n=1 Tax=Rhodosorus marinus TaxID=101924 RepID=A0AAV8V1B1_9RHOD|nr:hypothetical protein NDN08_007772 [Rhodosorus marinus]